MDRDYIALQHQFGGQWVATRDGEVVAHTASLGELHRPLEAADAWTADVLIEYVEPPDVVSVY